MLSDNRPSDLNASQRRNGRLIVFGQTSSRFGDAPTPSGGPLGMATWVCFRS